MSKETKKQGHNVSEDMIRGYVTRLEKLEEEKQALAEDIKEVFAEAKGNGLPTDALRVIIKERKADKDKLDEREFWVHKFRVALGMATQLEDEEESVA